LTASLREAKILSMSGIVKKIALVMVVLVALVIALFMYLVHYDEQRLRAGTNPCQNACLQDSGGVDDCRKHCASHPLTYGPAVPIPSR